MQTRWAAIGGRIREARAARGLDQASLGARLGLERSVVAKIEAGSRRLTAVELLDASEALAVPMGWLVRPSERRVVSRRDAVGGDSGHPAEGFDLALALEEWAEDVLQMRDLGLLHEVDLPVLRAGDPADARLAARTLRGHLGVGREPLAAMTDVADRCGVWLWVADVEGEGAGLDLGDGTGAAVVSGRADPGRRRFTAAHEIGHHVLADAYEVGAGVAASRPVRESLIDAFAGELLLPEDVVRSALAASDDVRSTLVELAGRYRVSWGAAVTAAHRLGEAVAKDPRPTRAEFVQVLGTAPAPDLEPTTTSSGWQQAVIRAVEKDLFTKVRAAEMLRGDWVPADLP